MYRKWINLAVFVFMLMALTVQAHASVTDIDTYIEGLLNTIDELQGQGKTPQEAKIKRTTDEVISFNAGETRDVTVTVTNIGDWQAKDISVSASTGDSAGTLTVDLASGSAKITTLAKNGTKSLSLRVKAAGTAEAGVYGIDLGFTYRNTKNEIVTDTEKLYIKIADDKSKPEIIIRDFTADSGVRGGDEFKLTAVLQNAGDAVAKDVQVMVDGLDPTKVFLSGSSNNLYYSALGPQAAQSLSFSLRAHEDIKSGSYPLKFSIKYRDENNEAGENEYTYYVNVTGADDTGRAYLDIPNMPALNAEYGVAEEFTVVFDVINTGAAAAKNVKVTATSDVEAIVPRSANIRSATELHEGASARFSFSFAPTAKAQPKNHVISFKVEYETGVKTEGVAETDSFEQFIGVNVDNPDADDEETKISKPKIIIDSYKVEPLIVKAGQQFDISMVFRNTHSSKNIGNIKVVLTPNEPTENSSSPFMPVDGSNTFYISGIAPGGTAAKDFKMYAIPNAEPRAYTITVSFMYQDDEYNEYTEEEIIGVTVKQTTKLDTGNIMMQTEGFMGQPVYVNFNLMNTGKSTLNNLTVEIVGEGFDVSKSFMYFGSLSKSGSSYYDAELIPLMPGNQAGKIVISYEDEAGEVTTVERDFVMNVMDMEPMPEMEFPMEMMGMEGMEGGGGFKDKALGYAKNPLVWVGIVGVGIGAFFGKKYYDKKKRPQYDE